MFFPELHRALQTGRDEAGFVRGGIAVAAAFHFQKFQSPHHVIFIGHDLGAGATGNRGNRFSGA